MDSALPKDVCHMDEDCIVAMFDILGFKDHVMHETHELVVDEMREMLGFWVPNARLSNVTQEDLKAVEDEPELGIRAVLNRVPDVGYIHFSDTIVYYRRGITPLSLEEVLHASVAFTGRALSEGIPVRGAMAGGRLCLERVGDRELYVGLPLIHAYVLANRTDWIGGVVDPNLLDRFDGQEYMLRKLGTLGALREYDVPLHKGKRERMAAIGWPLFYHFGEERLRTDLESYSSPIDEGVKRKHDETIAFLRWFKAQQPSPVALG